MDNQAQEVINAVKAASFDQITGLNTQLAQAQQNMQQQNAILQEVVNIISPDNPNLTVEQLIATLKDAFKTEEGENADG